jgi:glutaredoxin
MFDEVRVALYRAITSPKGDSFSPLRIQKDFARRLNVVLGSPLAPADELEKRKAARARLADLRRASRGGSATTPPLPTEIEPELAPVMVYFQKDRNARELVRVEETLGAKGIAYKLLDVTGDEAALDFVMREAHCEEDELPIVFVGGVAVGGFRQLVEADVSGELQRALAGG